MIITGVCIECLRCLPCTKEDVYVGKLTLTATKRACGLQGQTRGPCSIAQFRRWLADMRVRPELAREYCEFLECMVWRSDTPRMPLSRLVT